MIFLFSHTIQAPALKGKNLFLWGQILSIKSTNVVSILKKDAIEDNDPMLWLSFFDVCIWLYPCEMQHS